MMFSQTDDLEFWTESKKFGLRVPKEQCARIIDFCAEAGCLETGGILVGYYTERHDCAIVTGVAGPTNDSKKAKSRFYRGYKGLQTWLHKLWVEKKEFYIGEWHFHPLASPRPSGTDENQMVEISVSLTYNCLEPVMMIIGGNPPESWAATVFVFPKDEDHQELIYCHLET